MTAESLPEVVARVGALPMPVGSEPRTLDVVEEELTGANLSLYEEEQETARLRLALASAQRGRRQLRARVAELEAANRDAVRVSETLSRRLHDEMLAGSALYAALTMPTTPEQLQAALDRFRAVAKRIPVDGTEAAS